MASLTITPKDRPSDVQKIENNEAVITGASVIDLKLKKEDIESSNIDGTSLVIILKNGEKIILQNFISEKNDDQNIVLISDELNGHTLLQFNEQGQITDYLGNVNPDELLVSQQQNTAQHIAVNNDDETFSLANFFEEHGSKVGLGVATLLGVAPLLFKSEKEKGAPVPPDTQKPDPATTVLSTDGNKITGMAEANSSIVLLDSAKNIIARATVDGSGKYEVEIPKESQTGQAISVFVEDGAGNVSTEVKVTSLDKVPPLITSAQMNEGGNNVIGKSEPESNVYLYDKNGKLLASAKTNVAGDFSIILQSALAKGEIAHVIVEDKAGNESAQYQVSPGKDTTPPAVPTVLEVSEKGSVLKGRAEPNSELKLQNAKGDVIAEGKTDANGDFSLKISPALTEADQAKLFVTDQNKNTSQPATIKSNTDTLAPDAPTASLSKDGLEITGKAESGVTVVVKSLDNKVVLGTATADQDGNYKITLEKALTDKVKVNVTAQDAAKNDSTILILEGIDKDTIAPGLASITEIKDDVGAEKGIVKNNAATDDSKPTFIGKGESGATVSIYDNDNLIGSAKVNAQGVWEFTPQKELALGDHTITLYQTDGSNNLSLVSSKYTFKIVAPTTMSEVNSFASSSLIDDVITNAISSSDTTFNDDSVNGDINNKAHSLENNFVSSNLSQDVFELQQPTSLF